MKIAIHIKFEKYSLKYLQNNIKAFSTFVSSKEFQYGVLTGTTIILIVGYSPLITLWIQSQLDPITIDDCKYGLHHDIFGTRCITISEMREILGCEDFYLRDGYWWECITV